MTISVAYRRPPFWRAAKDSAQPPGLQSPEHQTDCLNDALDTLSVPFGINEAIIEAALDKLKRIGVPDQPQYWLLLARITELTLVCAGHYIDHLEFEAAGDLLFNPRQVLVYRKGHPHPTVKNRHRSLSRHLRRISGWTTTPSARWLRGNVSIAVTRPALLPRLILQIEQSGCISTSYLNGVNRRMKQASDAIGFLSALHMSSYVELLHYLKRAQGPARRLISENLCRFDTVLFRKIGDDLRRLRHDPCGCSMFLCSGPSTPSLTPAQDQRNVPGVRTFR